MRKRKILLYVFIIFILLSSFIEEFSYLFEDINLNPFDYARITDINYKAELVDEPGSKGKVVVTERITFDIHAASKDNLFWELWRDLPESYVDGVKVEYKVNSVKQILDDGTELIYTESPKLYWNDSDYLSSSKKYGPGKWYHSEGPYNESARRYECVFFYVNGLYRENVTFEIEYEMYNAAVRYGDCSELYLSFYSEDTIKYLNSFNGQILIPKEDMPRSGNYEAHTYGTNANEFPFTESDTVNPGYHTFIMSLDKSQLKFRPYNKYIEFSLLSFGLDKNKFTDYASRHPYYDYDALEEIRQEQAEYETIPKEYRFKKVFVLISCIIIAIIIIVYIKHKINKIKKQYVFYKPTIQVDYFREIPSNLDPLFASHLVFCKHKWKAKKNETDGYSSLMLSLVRKGYIALEKKDSLKDWYPNNVNIIVKYKPQSIVNPYYTPTRLSVENYEPNLDDTSLGAQYNKDIFEKLTPSEEYYFNLIVKHSHDMVFTMQDFQDAISSDYVNTNNFLENIKNSTVDIGISQGYFQKADYEEPKRNLNLTANIFLVFGIILLVIVNLISYQTHLDLAFGGFTILGVTLLLGFIYLKLVAKKYILLTQFGEDEYAKWHGLYRFLNSETLMNERTVVDLPLWEQYLVYATAFGVSEKVIAALKIRCPNVEMSPLLSNSYYTSKNFYVTSRSFRTAAIGASHIARSNSYGSFGGFSAHGGYGGGGRGGGGGRRRSLIKSSFHLYLLKQRNIWDRFKVCPKCLLINNLVYRLKIFHKFHLLKTFKISN